MLLFLFLAVLICVAPSGVALVAFGVVIVVVTGVVGVVVAAVGGVFIFALLIWLFSYSGLFVYLSIVCLFCGSCGVCCCCRCCCVWGFSLMFVGLCC